MENTKEIWALLRGKGFSEIATAGIMGNIDAESGGYSDRVQGDIPYSSWSKSYTAQVDSGRISRSEFIYEGPCGGGFGLCQWTFWQRKEFLFDFAKKKGTSIGSLATQVEFLVWELQNNYKACYNALMSSKTIREAAVAFVTQFERCTGYGTATVQNKRTALAEAVYNECHGVEPSAMVQEAEQPVVEDEKKVVVLSRKAYESKRSDYTMAAQYLLKAHGYSLTADALYGKKTEAAIIDVQEKNGLDVNGLCDEKTWAVLTKE